MKAEYDKIMAQLQNYKKNMKMGNKHRQEIMPINFYCLYFIAAFNLKS